MPHIHAMHYCQRHISHPAVQAVMIVSKLQLCLLMPHWPVDLLGQVKAEVAELMKPASGQPLPFEGEAKKHAVLYLSLMQVRSGACRQSGTGRGRDRGMCVRGGGRSMVNGALRDYPISLRDRPI